MNATSKFYLVLCLAAAGCMDAEPGDTDESGLGGDEPTTETTEQELSSSHFYSRSYGGSLFSTPFDYVSQQFEPAGACTPGFVRPVQPVVQWTSNSGGWCGFVGWDSSDTRDCRARIVGSTGGGGFGGTCNSWVQEVPDPGSPPTGVFNYIAANTNSAQTNTTNYSISVNPGQTLTVGTCGMTGASFSGDTYLRLYNSSGTLIAASDDACGLGSKIVYTATSVGSLQVRAGCFSNRSCSGTVAWLIQ